MPMSIFDLVSKISFAGWSMVILSICAFLLCAVIYLQDTKNRTNRMLLIFAGTVVLWDFPNLIFSASIGTTLAYYAFPFLYLSAALVPLTLFLYYYVFFQKDEPLDPFRIAFIISPYIGIGVLMAVVPDFLVSYQGVVGEGAPDKIIFGKGYSLYVAYILGFLALSLWLLIKKYHESAGLFKFQVRGLLYNFVGQLSAAVFMMFISPLIAKGEGNLFWVGHIIIIIGLFSMCYMVVKYNFWSLKVVLAEFFISVILLTILIELFFATSVSDLFIKSAVTLLVIFSSFFLVESVKREVQSKEKIEGLFRDLDAMHIRLQVLDQKKSEFLSIASHHLRDPLTGIKGYASMLLEGSFGEISQPIREALEKIFESSARLITMISDFMDISNIESGDMQYKFTDVDMKELVRGVVDEMKQNADRMHLVLSLEIEGESKEKYITIADAGKIRQVVANLIDNSIKYTPKGEVIVLLSKTPDKKKIVFSLSDTGIGMSELTKEKIFKKFSRAEGVNKVYTEGTGLGLYVASEIVKKHEGRIWAESAGEGHGSQFYVELDAKK